MHEWRFSSGLWSFLTSPFVSPRPILNKSHTSTEHEGSMLDQKVQSVTWEHPSDFNYCCPAELLDFEQVHVKTARRARFL